MFKQKFRKVLLIILSLVLLSFTLTSCGEKEIDRTNKYLIVKDNYGTEYRVDGYDTFKVPFVNEKSYGFTYEAFYYDNDEPTGEQGNLGMGRVCEPGKYVSLFSLLHTSGFAFTFIIEELPMFDLTVKFDHRNAIEYTDKERYVYDYNVDGRKYPIVLLYDGETLLETHDNRVFFQFLHLGKNEGASSPLDLGVYEAVYRIGPFENKERTKKYKGVEIKFTIELIEVVR